MPRKKQPRTWFRMYGSNLHVFEALSDEAVGKSVKYALRYFVLDEAPPDTLDPLTMIGFSVLRGAADEAITDYEVAVENGRKGPAAKEAKKAEGEGG